MQMSFFKIPSFGSTLNNRLCNEIKNILLVIRNIININDQTHGRPADSKGIINAINRSRVKAGKVLKILALIR